MKPALGTPCALTYDWEGEDGKQAPGVGDVLVSTGGSGYLILEARRVRSTVHPCRWHYRCLRVDPRGDPKVTANASFHPLFWHSRKRRRQTVLFGGKGISRALDGTT